MELRSVSQCGGVKSEWKVKKLRKHRCTKRKEEKREIARRNIESKEILLYRFF